VTLGFDAAADALEAALRAGVDPEADPPRTVLGVGEGQLLVMPSAAGGHGVVKLVSVGGDPRIQGLCVVFDRDTLAPALQLDGVELTNLRTAAVSLLAVRHLAPRPPRRVVIFGRGPQARAHAAALGGESVLLGRGDDPAPVAAADVVCCCTTAREPLFDGRLVRDDAVVVAIGSHEPDAREVDAALVERATVVVESRGSAAREAGDLILAGRTPDLTLAELVAGAPVPEGLPRLFKSTGMAWEDAVVAAAIHEASRGRTDGGASRT